MTCAKARSLALRTNSNASFQLIAKVEETGCAFLQLCIQYDRMQGTGGNMQKWAFCVDTKETSKGY